MGIKYTHEGKWIWDEEGEMAKTGNYTVSYGTTTTTGSSASIGVTTIGSGSNVGITGNNVFVYQDPDTKRWIPIDEQPNHFNQPAWGIFEPAKETQKMARGLFIVYAVEPEKGEVVYKSEPLVAENEELAKMAAARELPKEWALADYDFVVVRLGNIREKRKESK